MFGIVIVRLPIPLAGIGAGSNTKVAGSNQSVPKGVRVRWLLDTRVGTIGSGPGSGYREAGSFDSRRGGPIR